MTSTIECKERDSRFRDSLHSSVRSLGTETPREGAKDHHGPPNWIENSVVQKYMASQEGRPGDQVHELDRPVFPGGLNLRVEFVEGAVNGDLISSNLTHADFVGVDEMAAGERFQPDEPHTGG